jgi:hypothetical protein
MIEQLECRKMKNYTRRNMNSFGRKIAIVIMALAIIASSIGVVSAETYNRQAAVDYAKEKWDSKVPGSWYFMPWPHQADCTNFVSQVLYIKGGWPQRGTEWTPNYQWYFNNAFPRDYSNSWTTVIAFGNFIVTSRRGTEISFSRNDVWARPTQFTIGDIMQADWTGDGTWDHTMMITGITGNDILLTYHNKNRLDKKITEIIKENQDAKFRVFLLKNTFTY